MFLHILSDRRLQTVKYVTARLGNRHDSAPNGCLRDNTASSKGQNGESRHQKGKRRSTIAYPSYAAQLHQASQMTAFVQTQDAIELAFPLFGPENSSCAVH